MSFRNSMLAKQSVFIVSVLGFSGWAALAGAASCEPSVAKFPQAMTQGYFRPATPVADNVMHLGSFSFNDQYAGTLIQSFAFDEAKCKWLMAASVGRKPETVIISEFPPVAPYLSERTSSPLQGFSHPQDLSLSIQEGKAELWLPDRTRKGVSRFNMNAEGQVEGVKGYRLSTTPVRGYFSSVSTDGQYLVTMGTVGKGKNSLQQVNVYNRKDVVGSEGVSGDIKPIYTWLLDDAQQDHKQWRQGMAVVGNTVFVLTGNGRANQEKLLGSYRLEGGVIAINNLPDAKSNQLMKGKLKTYEPEGLEVISYNGELALAFGMAGGTKGRRSFDVWVMPLVR
ncbi:hypothetical protein [Pseudomonas taetrolens]|uniref:phage baseplate protein n=1 Tax=Pseudomonas taetrolens TaxID=47884 RepID=UPI0030DBD3FF